MKAPVMLGLLAAALAGCGNIAAVKSFNTPYGSPSGGDTARLRVIADGMVRAVPEKDCVDWYSPGAGVIAVPTKGFADRNGETLGMPAGVSAQAGDAVSEVLVPAGKPFTLHFLDGGRSAGYDTVQNCLGMFSFVPQKGADYELVVHGYSACGGTLKRLDKAEDVARRKADYCSAMANF
ncbi:hypothetical protein [Pseudomonas sp. JR33AA]|uniref:hypothetical protein n=1 Tax=Pseudomonas sp. JR33AA TaxID=2899113 RepID=UPI001F1A98C8|nr:hypothetical protein [Pseudomonas sp. JR33AA]MCE5978302.1 hypothetical protein [Pseudomonas sp. JR33AA]